MTKKLACKVCGREFESRRALGGHMSTAHPKSREESDGNPGEVELKQEHPETPEDEESVADDIRGYLGQGFSFEQLTKEFHFNPRSVRREMAKVISPKGEQNSEPERDGTTLVRKEKESVLPEWLEGEVAEVFDGDKPTQKIFMAGMAVPLLGLRLFGEAVNPLTKLMSTWQEGQAKVFEAMQGSNTEAAQQAAAMAGSQVMAHMDEKFAQTQEKKKDIAETPDPMKGLMARTMEQLMNQITGQMFGGGQGGQGGQGSQNMAGPTPGMVDKRQQGG